MIHLRTARRAAGALAAVGLIVAALDVGTDAAAQPAQPAAQTQGKDVKGRSFVKQTLRDEDFRRQDLQGADFTLSILRNATFAGADLRRAIFRSANLGDADLTGADLRGADLLGASFVGAKMRSANLEDQELYLAGADIHFENIHKLPYAIREAARPDLNNGTLTFQAANLRNAKIYGSLDGVDFRRADLRGADLTKTTDIGKATFRGAIYDSRTKWTIDPKEAGAVKGEEAPVSAKWFVGLWGIDRDRPGEPQAPKVGRLKILENGTFEWDAGDEKPMTGKWEAMPAAGGAPPQIKLRGGELGQDWIGQPSKEDLILKSGDGKKSRSAFRG